MTIAFDHASTYRMKVAPSTILPMYSSVAEICRDPACGAQVCHGQEGASSDPDGPGHDFVLRHGLVALRHRRHGRALLHSLGLRAAAGEERAGQTPRQPGRAIPRHLRKNVHIHQSVALHRVEPTSKKQFQSKWNASRTIFPLHPQFQRSFSRVILRRSEDDSDDGDVTRKTVMVDANNAEGDHRERCPSVRARVMEANRRAKEEEEEDLTSPVKGNGGGRRINFEMKEMGRVEL